MALSRKRRKERSNGGLVEDGEVPGPSGFNYEAPDRRQKGVTTPKESVCDTTGSGDKNTATSSSACQPSPTTPWKSYAENNRKIECILGDGISIGDIGKLKACGFNKTESVAYSPKKKISCIQGISELKAEKILVKCQNATPGLGFSPASLVLRTRHGMIKIKTGSDELDNLLGGGVETGSITEIYGASASGKTFFCHQMAINCQLPVDAGGAEAKAIFIDTCNSFRTERLIACGAKLGLDAQTAMDGVIYSRGYNCEQIMKLLIEASAIMVRDRIGLLILDSATKLLRVEFCGRGELAESQAFLGMILRFLKGLAEQYGIAVIITNEVVAYVDGSNVHFGPAYKAVGGHVLAHQIVSRLHIKKVAMGNRMVRLEKSPSMPESECLVKFVDEGIVDANVN